MARRLFIAAIVAIALGGPIVEMFDSWDQTLSNGNDTEGNVVVAALCMGIAFTVGTVIIIDRIRALSSTPAGLAGRTCLAVHEVAPLVVSIPSASPPSVLRV